MAERARYIGEISKQTTENRPLSVDFTDRIPSGTTISSCAVSAYILPSGVSDSSVISGNLATIAGNVCSIRVLNGSNNFRYRVTFTATLNDGSVLKEDVLMQVENVR